MKILNLFNNQFLIQLFIFISFIFATDSSFNRLRFKIEQYEKSFNPKLKKIIVTDSNKIELTLLLNLLDIDKAIVGGWYDHEMDMVLHKNGNLVPTEVHTLPDITLFINNENNDFYSVYNYNTLKKIKCYKIVFKQIQLDNTLVDLTNFNSENALLTSNYSFIDNGIIFYDNKNCVYNNLDCSICNDIIKRRIGFKNFKKCLETTKEDCKICKKTTREDCKMCKKTTKEDCKMCKKLVKEYCSKEDCKMCKKLSDLFYLFKNSDKIDDKIKFEIICKFEKELNKNNIIRSESYDFLKQDEDIEMINPKIKINDYIKKPYDFFNKDEIKSTLKEKYQNQSFFDSKLDDLKSNIITDNIIDINLLNNDTSESIINKEKEII